MASKWFDRLSPTARQAYLRSHPGSKFKKSSGKSKPSTNRKVLKPKAKRSRSSLYFVQPNGTWKKGGDGRSAGRTLAEVKAIKRPGKKVGKRRM